MRILIPKKVAPLATRRNRLRRLIREALRREHVMDSDKVYLFRSLRDPGQVGLAKVCETIDELLPSR